MTRGTLGIIVTVVLVPLLLAELTECGRWLAERLLRWAARRLRDPEATARYEEEWVANLRHVPGKLTPLVHAILVFVLAVPRMRATPAADKPRPWRVVGLAYGLGVGLAYGLGGVLGGGLVGGLAYGLAYGLVGGLVGGLAYGLVGGQVGVLGGGLAYGLVGGLVGGLAYGLGVGVVGRRVGVLGVGLAYGLVRVARSVAARRH